MSRKNKKKAPAPVLWPKKYMVGKKEFEVARISSLIESQKEKIANQERWAQPEPASSLFPK